MSRVSKACDISPKVRAKVYGRDSIDGAPCCIFCGKPHGLQIAHYVGRAQMGLGIPENLVTACVECHAKMDNGADGVELRNEARNYLKAIYKGWDEKELIYDKWK